MIALPVPDVGPLFEGHFPGRPILPGIALLDLALRAHAAGGHPVALRGIETLRFRRLVLPGEILDLEVTPGGAARVALAVRRGGDRVAEAVVDLGSARRAETSSATPAPGAQPVLMAQAIPMAPPGPRPEMPAPEGLLPHRPPAHLVVGIEACSEAGAVCSARVPETHPLVASGAAPALMAIEMAAQAAGIFEALIRAGVRGRDTAGGAAEEAGAERLGYLVGARGVRFLRAAIPVETVCRATVRLVAAAGALSSYDFEVTDGSVTLAAGRVSTWLTATGA
jgi:3-hydroxymyristoyl/3-hydroxydecanoyl-(acyl carrier protein) dehydratase